MPEIRIIGIGGGGGAIVSEIAKNVKKASFVVVDTDLGEKKTKNLFLGIDFCILISCLGGKTGSNILPILTEVSREFKLITLGIFVLPFEFEGEKKMRIAKSALEKISPNLNALVIISNQKLFCVVNKKTSLKEALSAVNKQVAESLKGLIELLYSSDLININLSDLRTILAGRGKLAFLNSIEAETTKPIHPVRGQRVQTEAQKKRTSNRVQGIARKVVHNRLSPYLSYKAKKILFGITAGETFTLNETNQIGSIITNLVNPRAQIIFGVGQNKEYKDKIRITLLATGCQWQELLLLSRVGEIKIS